MTRREDMLAPDCLDLRGTPCPANASRALLRLETMDPGALLEIRLDLGEPVESVRQSLEMEGHQVVAEGPLEAGWWFRVRAREER